MADYPGSVFSPATINNGATIDASHQNEPNDEINAMQNALVNGNIAHDITPSSSAERSLGAPTKRWSSLYVDAIQSTGNSTLGNVTVGNLTVTNLQVNGGSSGTGGSQEYARVFNGSDIAISSGQTILTFDSQRGISNSSMHSTASNSSRLTAQSSGMHFISGHVKFRSTGVLMEVAILVDNVVIAVQNPGHRNAGGANATSTDVALSVATAFPMTSTSWAKLRVSASDTNTIRATTDQSPCFTMSKF